MKKVVLSLFLTGLVTSAVLGAIAQRFYGKASLYPKIFEANRDVLQNPDLIKAGQKLKIPKA